jgi:hypothetical protein
MGPALPPVPSARGGDSLVRQAIALPAGEAEANNMLVGWKPKSDDTSVASVRFRCLTPLNELKRTGFGVELYSPEKDAAGAYSAVIFSKLYGQRDQQTAASLRRRGVKTILDVCDNHFYNPFDLPDYRRAAIDLRQMARLVDRVVCCSQHLAGVVAKESGLDLAPLIVGDAVEAMTLPPDSRDPFVPPAGDPFRIVWFGSHGSPNAPSGMEDLLLISKHLEKAAKVRACELVVISNKQQKFEALKSTLPIPSRYVEWADGALMTEFSRANLVVVPVNSNPFTKCKSNNRVATALWYGLPTIADRVPAYDDLAEFAVIGDWEFGFEQAIATSREMQVRTAAGASYVRAHFGNRQIAAEWRRAIKIVHSQSAKGQLE